MQPFRRELTDQDLDRLIVHLKTLWTRRSQWPREKEH